MTVLSDRAIERLCTKPLLVHKLWGNVKDAFAVIQDGKLVTQGTGAEICGPERLEAFLVRVKDEPYRENWRFFDELEGWADTFTPMIAPFVPHQVRVDDTGRKIISYGCSAAGYDIRLGSKFKIFTNVNATTIDPLNMDEKCYVEFETSAEQEFCIVPPNSYVLGHTPETFCIPKDIAVVVLGKSTYARCGLAVNCTPMEPGWPGQLVVELANQTPLPIKVYSGMGIAQAMFHQLDAPARVPYGPDRKYYGQTGLTTARV